MPSAVLVEKLQPYVYQLRLNEPDSRNAMSPTILQAYGQAVEEVTKFDDMRVLIITGTGSCFSAGANLNHSLKNDDAGSLPHEGSFEMYRSFLKTLDVKVPTIAALNGHAVGGGFGLSLLADIRIGNQDAKYGANFARLGIHSGLGISYTLPRIVGESFAAEMLFSGRLIKGKEAASRGLFSRAVPKDNVAQEAKSLAADIAAAAPLAVQTMKSTLRRFRNWQVQDAAYYESFLQASTLDTQDAAEGIAALLEKRAPVFRGQ